MIKGELHYIIVVGESKEVGKAKWEVINYY